MGKLGIASRSTAGAPTIWTPLTVRAGSPHDTPSTGLRVLVCLAAVGCTVGPVAACGLSLSGLAPTGGPSLDGSLVDSIAPGGDASTSADGAINGENEAGPSDAGIEDSTPLADVADAAPSCSPRDAGLGGPLSAFVLTGVAAYNENSDGRITLTNSSNDQAGAAWYPTTLPPLAGYDLTWSLRVGPSDTDGEGITFAVLSSRGAPGVGDDGEGLGLQNITASGGDGGVLAGYAVEVVMYDNTSDPTNLGPVTLKLATMPGFTPVAELAVPTALNDGNTYAVDVSWRAPSYLSATLHGPDGGVFNVTSSNPGLTAPSAYFGFTGATGGVSDSHNEIAGFTVSDTCE
jgi:Bacterial lectin